MCMQGTRATCSWSSEPERSSALLNSLGPCQQIPWLPTQLSLTHIHTYCQHKEFLLVGSLDLLSGAVWRRLLRHLRTPQCGHRNGPPGPGAPCPATAEWAFPTMLTRHCGYVFSWGSGHGSDCAHEKCLATSRHWRP